MKRPILLALAMLGALWLVGTKPAMAEDQPETANQNQTAQPTPTPTPAEPVITTYEVQRGDYLEKIAKQHNISWPSIYELNDQISNPDIIYSKQQLEVPDHDVPLTRQLPGATTMKVPDNYQPQVTVKSATPVTKVKPATQSVNLSGGRGASVAVSLVGLPYKYGGTTKAGFDCSGLTQYVAAQYGIQLPRTVIAQYSATTRITKGQLQSGDLVFFNAHHVGIYIGGGQIVHAATPALGVRVDSLESAIAYNGYMGAGRW